jgi:hypothetical protein
MTLAGVTLPPMIDQLVDEIAPMPGVVAVVLGGSRAMGTDDAKSDWDIGVYYRGALGTSRLSKRGTVYPPGEWGRITNGGAWLTCGEHKVDVLLRNLDVVEHWSQRANEGVFEIDYLLGYLAGVPTYSLLAERAVCRLLRGELAPVGDYPPRLASGAPDRWRFHSRFSLDHARSRARRGDLVGTLGQSAKAIIEQAHALLCERRVWVLNEKQIVERAGLERAHEMLASAPRDAARLVAWVSQVEATLGAHA